MMAGAWAAAAYATVGLAGTALWRIAHARLSGELPVLGRATQKLVPACAATVVLGALAAALDSEAAVAWAVGAGVVFVVLWFGAAFRVWQRLQGWGSLRPGATVRTTLLVLLVIAGLMPLAFVPDEPLPWEPGWDDSQHASRQRYLDGALGWALAALVPILVLLGDTARRVFRVPASAS